MLYMPTLREAPLESKRPATGDTRGESAGPSWQTFANARDLLLDGLACLQCFWGHRPQAQQELRTEGGVLQEGLLAVLETEERDDAVIGTLLFNCGNWYLDVRLQSGADNGKASPDEWDGLTEVQAEIDRHGQSPSNGQPPDPQWWARILQKLVDAVKDRFGRQEERMDALEADKAETVARINAQLDALQTGQNELQAGQAALQESVRNLETGQAELRAGQNELRGDVKDLQAGQNELQAGQAELRGDVKDLQAGQAELRGDVKDLQAGQAELRGDVKDLQSGQAVLQESFRNLETGQAELRDGQNELRDGQNELLEHVRDGIGRDLQFLSHAWAANAFPRFWRSHMRGSPGAPHEHWTPRLHPSLALWHDLLDLEAWSAYRQAFGLPETIRGADMQADLLTRFDYELVNGKPLSFLLLGEVARQADTGDVARLLNRRNLLWKAGVDIPIVLCLFAQNKIESTRAQALMAEHNILHLFRGGHNRFQGWESDAHAKLRRYLGWDQAAA